MTIQSYLIIISLSFFLLYIFLFNFNSRREASNEEFKHEKEQFIITSTTNSINKEEAQKLIDLKSFQK